MQEKQFKKFKDLVPGKITGINVHDGLERAIRKWKRMMKDSNTVTELFERREFIKPSVSKKKTKDTAKFKQYRRDQSEK